MENNDDGGWRRFAVGLADDLPGASEHIHGLLAWYDSPAGKEEIDAWTKRKREGPRQQESVKMMTEGMTIVVAGLVATVIGFQMNKKKDDVVASE